MRKFVAQLVRRLPQGTADLLSKASEALEVEQAQIAILLPRKAVIAIQLLELSLGGIRVLPLPYLLHLRLLLLVLLLRHRRCRRSRRRVLAAPFVL